MSRNGSRRATLLGPGYVQRCAEARERHGNARGSPIAKRSAGVRCSRPGRRVLTPRISIAGKWLASHARVDAGIARPALGQPQLCSMRDARWAVLGSQGRPPASPLTGCACARARASHVNYLSIYRARLLFLRARGPRRAWGAETPLLAGHPSTPSLRSAFSRPVNARAAFLSHCLLPLRDRMRRCCVLTYIRIPSCGCGRSMAPVHRVLPAPRDRRPAAPPPRRNSNPVSVVRSPHTVSLL
ncbi:hypothetical protein BV25DRAFT_1824697 [Artomyces pyxidatus]|uniref:Uncharacterized protein n=1 Tax=Artomyces pyxidatus TaxID=48021 RepID=A0ACB8T342_9AGAM|nr:hypothetical protein BV25DRAFT_1824697 [Artomyces pyxidatus]